MKGQPIPTESRSPGGSKAEGVVVVGSPEKSPRGGEVKPETVPRNRITSVLSSSPKPPLQGPKPALAARPSILQKPRTGSSRSIGRPVIWSIEMYRYTRYSYILPLVWITARRIGRQGITFGPPATGAGR